MPGMSLQLIPLSSDIDAGRDFLNARCLQIGHVLPLNDKRLDEYFPSERSFLLLQGKKPTAILSYFSKTHKGSAMARFNIVTDSRMGLRESIRKVEETALAQEKLIVHTSVLGYDKEKLRGLRSLGYAICASLPETVSLHGRRYDWHLLYKDLTGRYSFKVSRAYARPGLYPPVEVRKPEKAKLKVRGYRAQDRETLDRLASHQMVIKGIGSGVFEGLYPWPSGGYQAMVDSGRIYPIVCEAENTGQPVGLADLWRHPQDVMQHTMMLGIIVAAEYQGIGVGTMLMEAIKTLAMRLHLSSVWLSVFDGNTPAERLYRRAGFVECGKLPGWLQEGYVNETYMTLKLD